MCRAAGLQADEAKMLQVTPLIRERIRVLNDVTTVADLFFVDELPPYDPAELIPQKGDAAMAVQVLEQAREVLGNGRVHARCPRSSAARTQPTSLKVKTGQMFLPIRVAVCGRKTAPPLFETLEVLGRETSLKRIEQARSANAPMTKRIMNTLQPEAGATDRVQGAVELHSRHHHRGPEDRQTTRAACKPAFLRSRTAICISATRKRSASISVWPPSSAASAICGSTIPIRRKKKPSTSTRSGGRALAGLRLGDRLFYASDYFDQLYEWAVQLIKAGKAYVCDLTAEEIREYRGTLTEPGKESPYRNRSVEENLDLFERMKNGRVPGRLANAARQDRHGFAESQHARSGDVPHPAHGSIIARATSGAFTRCTTTRTGSRIRSNASRTRSARSSSKITGRCTTGSSSSSGIFPSQQIEFDRLNLTYTLLSKRKLLQLVQDRHVSGWDDPRMPTLSGIRRRGYTPEAIRNFCAQIGVSKTNGITQLALLEHFVREDLNKHAPRVMAVLRPLRVVIDNYPDDLVEEMDAVNNPEDASAGTRKVPFSKVLYIEQDDFREDPPKQYFRLAPGREVRLRYGYFITCIERRERRQRQRRRTPLHLRSRDARRQRPGRAEGEVDYSLGLGGARRRCRSAALRQALHERESQATLKKGRTSPRT